MSSLVGLEDVLGLSAGGYDLCAVVSSPQVISSPTDGSRYRRDRLNALSCGDLSRPMRTTLCPTEISIRWRPLLVGILRHGTKHYDLLTSASHLVVSAP